MRTSIDNALVTVLWFMYGRKRWGHDAALNHWKMTKRIRKKEQGE